jgi:hypothetical protein
VVGRLAPAIAEEDLQIGMTTSWLSGERTGFLPRRLRSKSTSLGGVGEELEPGVGYLERGVGRLGEALARHAESVKLSRRDLRADEPDIGIALAEKAEAAALVALEGRGEDVGQLLAAPSNRN